MKWFDDEGRDGHVTGAFFTKTHAHSLHLEGPSFLLHLASKRIIVLPEDGSLLSNSSYLNDISEQNDNPPSLVFNCSHSQMVETVLQYSKGYVRVCPPFDYVENVLLFTPNPHILFLHSRRLGQQKHTDH